MTEVAHLPRLSPAAERKRHGRMPAGGSRLGTTSADAYARAGTAPAMLASMRR